MLILYHLVQNDATLRAYLPVIETIDTYDFRPRALGGIVPPTATAGG